MDNSFKTRLKKLSLGKKMVLIGSLVSFVGVFLPWYQDIDRFNTGDTFLGITGPLYLAGLIVLFASGISLMFIGFNLSNKPLPKLPLSEKHFYVFASALSLLMLVLTSSVYSHNRFGMNITDKNIGIGMIMAFAGVAFWMLGGVLSNRKKKQAFQNDGSLEPLINIDTQDRVQNALDPDTDILASEPFDPAPVQESITGLSEESKDTNDIQING